MARRRKKTVQASVPAIHERQTRRAATGLIISIVITLLLGGVPFGLGKYIEFNSPGPFDSGAFVYSAQHLLDGAKLGVDEQSSARPGTLTANLIGVKLFGFNDIGPKVIQMMMQLAALGFMFYTLRKVFGSVASVVGTTIAAIYLSAPLIAKFGNVKEQFMIPFMIAAACCCLLHGYSQKRFWLILSGFFAVQPYYFKPTGLSVVIALGLYIFASNAFAKKFKSLIIEMGLFLAGYIGGLLVPGSLYLWQGVPGALLYSLPVVMIEAAVMLGVIVFAVAAVIILTKKHRLLAQLRRVSKWIPMAGLCSIVIVLIVSVFLIKIEPGSENSDIGSYFYDIPLISAPCRICFAANAQIDKLLAASGLRGGYVANSWKAIGLSNLAPKVFRYYRALSVPILLALGSVLTALWMRLRQLKTKTPPDDIQSKLVWMLAIWWLLDMAFVWGSPRSYEQYYLPLCGSAAMLGGFVIWKWQKQFSLAANKMPWLISGLAAMITLSCLSIPIFIGQRTSPDTAADYLKNYGHRRRGFGPALKELPSRKQRAWVAVGDYIHTHSDENDTIYVWGWVPGIYVQAQRLAPISRAFYGDMHVILPRQLAVMTNRMVRQFQKNPPRFIVDSRKRHFPNDRPALELWPIVPPRMFGNEKQRFLKNNPQEITAYDAFWSKMLETRIEPDEAKRYEAIKPLRDFVMNNYRIVRQYGNHVLFERK